MLTNKDFIPQVQENPQLSSNDLKSTLPKAGKSCSRHFLSQRFFRDFARKYVFFYLNIDVYVSRSIVEPRKTQPSAHRCPVDGENSHEENNHRIEN